MSLIHETIGNTPLIRLQRSAKQGRVFVKLESRNPGGSVKDRVAYQMVIDLLESKEINKDTLLIEPTSGNTGIGLCLVAAALEMKIAIVMPDSMSMERRQIMKAYGAQLYLTEGAKGIKGSVAKAEEIQKSTPNSRIVGQFINPSNPKAHQLNTAPELIRQFEQYQIKPSHFVCGVGTGGTITGCAPILREKYPEIKIVALEPANSAVISGDKAGPHKIQGIGPGFIPEVFDKNSYDIIDKADHEQAYQMVRQLARTEGLLVGISSAAAILQAIKYAEETGGDVIAVAADCGDRYLSVDGLFE